VLGAQLAEVGLERPLLRWLDDCLTLEHIDPARAELLGKTAGSRGARPGELRLVVELAGLERLVDPSAHFRSLGQRLAPGGAWLSCVETLALRRRRLARAARGPIRRRLLLAADGALRSAPAAARALARLPLPVELGPRPDKAVSRTEVLGRICAAGFEVVAERVWRGLRYVIARKVTTGPSLEHGSDEHRQLIGLTRVGRDQRRFELPKVRTMYPFARHLQGHLQRSHGLDRSGHIRNDFRIVPSRRWLRQSHLDELPNVLAWLRGQVKLVGVRPLSPEYLNLYPADLRRRRATVRPGLLPPSAVEGAVTLSELLACERHYLDAYQRHPLRTDLTYVLRAAGRLAGRLVGLA